MSDSHRKGEAQDEQQYEADRPQYQSVAIHSLSAPSLPSVSRAPLVREKISTRAATTTTPVVKKSTPPPPTTNLWRVPADLAPLPDIYPLERSHVYVDAATTSSREIAARITACLRLQCCKATYHDKEAMVEVETDDHVEFCVRLFAAPKQGQTVVEVQRLSGCCYTFRCYSRAILAAATGSDPSNNIEPAAPQRPCMSTIRSNLPRPTDAERERCLDEGLEIALTLLAKDRFDGRELAMTSLVQMTSNQDCRAMASERILNNSQAIAHVLHYVVVDADEDGADLRCSKQHRATMHHLALTVLANCVAAGACNCEGLTQPTTIACLLECLEHAATAPHDAYQAVRCLSGLIKTSDQAKTTLAGMKKNASKVVAAAHQHGMTSHVKLEHEAHQLHLQLQRDL